MPLLDRLSPRSHDLGGGFIVRRLLPSARRQAVGPFLFFDHFGPVTALPTDNHDVRPHPHIGLATVTYLFEGTQVHRDSTGVVQRIEPGAINWMTAGRGIVHSERTPDELRGIERRSHGLQLWTAVPPEHEEDAPSFVHTPAEAIPTVELPGARVRVLVGSAFGQVSPVKTLSPTVYLDIALEAGATLTVPETWPPSSLGSLPPEGALSTFGRPGGAVVAEERALYGVDQGFAVDGEAVPPFEMVVLEPGGTPVLTAAQACRLALVGGAPLGHRFMVWNFVSSRKERIHQAEDDWRAQRFDKVPGETEFIPLPPPRG
jgi:redox-sensitive bicupin YhaK (pirin superfamily)